VNERKSERFAIRYSLFSPVFLISKKVYNKTIARAVGAGAEIVKIEDFTKNQTLKFSTKEEITWIYTN